MSVPAERSKRLAIVSATEMIDVYALRYAPDHPAVGCVTSIGHRKKGICTLRLMLDHCSGVLTRLAISVSTAKRPAPKITTISDAKRKVYGSAI